MGGIVERRGKKLAMSSSPLTTTTPPSPPPCDQHEYDDDHFQKTEAQQLPRYIILKSKHNGNYLRQVDGTDLLQYTGPNGQKRLDVQFEIEVSETDEKFVHIRSLRNNRYLEFNQTTKFVTATGVGKVECTLFEPVLVSRVDNSYRLRHVFQNSSYYISMGSGSNLQVTTEDDDDDHATGVDVHIIVDSESILVLPRYVAFKGDNTLYVKTITDKVDAEANNLVFRANKITDPYVANEILPGADGLIQIKNVESGLYWTASEDSLFKLKSKSDTWFSPEKIGNKIIALRYAGQYCGLGEVPEYSDICFCVLGVDETVTKKDIRLEVEEPVVRRVISDISYNGFKGSRIHDEKRLLIANGEAVNRTSTENEFELNVKYSDSKTRSYNHNLSLKLTKESTVDASFIPCIVGGKIEYSAEVCGEKEWGNLTGSTKTVTKAIEVPVPNGSARKIAVIATQGWCDIPYTYTQKDTLINGEVKSYHQMEGVFQGANVYNMQWEVGKSQQLPPTA